MNIEDVKQIKMKINFKEGYFPKDLSIFSKKELYKLSERTDFDMKVMNLLNNLDYSIEIHDERGIIEKDRNIKIEVNHKSINEFNKYKREIIERIKWWNLNESP